MIIRLLVSCSGAVSPSTQTAQAAPPPAAAVADPAAALYECDCYECVISHQRRRGRRGVASTACALVIAGLAVVIVIILSQLDGDTDDVIADFFNRTSL